jgi:3-methyl-2-oxobutanoate hydroxymethyltransferase
VRGARQALVVVDMPFGSYQETPQLAFRHAARVLAETGCQAVKLEGGAEMAETIAFLTARGVPVCGHVGLMPQQVNVAGGFRATGRTHDEAARVTADAEAVARAGAFAVVLEGTLEPVAAAITAQIDIPTIGIGASAQCDGQVLVIDDVLGIFNDFTPRFVKRYAELGHEITRAVTAYAADVRARSFPAPENTFRQRR